MALAACLAWLRYDDFMRMRRLMPVCTGGHHTSVMPGTPARSSTFQAVDARMIAEQLPFSENEPGREPSMAPRRIGLLRWVMAVTRIVGFRLFSHAEQPRERAHRDPD